MFRLLGILLVGLVLAGCGPAMVALNVGPTLVGALADATSSSPATSNRYHTANMSDDKLCAKATLDGTWRSKTGASAYFVALAKRQGLTCGVGEASSTTYAPSTTYAYVSNDGLCLMATRDGKWETQDYYKSHVQEAKRRGLSCGVGEATQTASTPVSNSKLSKAFDSHPGICEYATVGYPVKKWRDGTMGFGSYVKEAKRRGLSCGVGGTSTTQIAASNLNPTTAADNRAEQGLTGFVPQGANVQKFDAASICAFATTGSPASWDASQTLYIQEAKRRGLTCGVGETTQTASAPVPKAKPQVTSAALTASQKEAESLRQRVAALEADKAKQQQTISSDTKLPTITIASADTKGKQGVIRGRANDNTRIAEITVSGQPVPFDAAGNFQYQTFVPTGGKDIAIEVTDLAGLTSKQTVSLTRSAAAATAVITFDSLNPLGRRVTKNSDALALIIGVDGYENTPARAIYADSDAQMFADYATEKLGIPANRIKTLVNDNADEQGMLLAIKDWLSRANRQDKTDIYIFFAGHGLASDDGEKMYLLPYDGSPRLLDKTAILRDELFADIASANPRSVTVFLDTCYSGTTRGTDMLIASRPIAIKALEQSIPDNFKVMTAAAGDQTAKPLEEAKHGMFSYFLMKGMEGEADKNQDNKITAGELHQYVEQNVVQQSSGSQTPELQGDAERVLVRFQ